MDAKRGFGIIVLVASLLLTACGDGADRAEAVARNEAPSSTGNTDAGQEGGVIVNVTLAEMTVTLDQTQAPAGAITFIVQNDGHAPHDFVITGNGVEQKIALLEPGQSATLTVELSPGGYEYKCTVPGHAIAGMRGTFSVT